MKAFSLPGATRPRILLVGLMAGMGGMHLPRHLMRAGLEVVFAGTRMSMASRSGHVVAFFPWQDEGAGLSVEPFLDCVRQCQPQWVIPLDEVSAQVLQQIGIGRLEGGTLALPGEVVGLIRRSLGKVEGYPLFAPRRHAFSVAQAAGIAVAPQAQVVTLDACLAFARQHGYPVVLKQEASFGGTGSAIVGDDAALREFIAARQIGEVDRTWVVQGYIAGQLGMHAVFADQGRVSAHLSAVQVTRRSDRLTAPSSVVRLQRHEAMAASAAAFVAATGASGFHAWDFQLDAAGRAVLIEHNPRPISISHLGYLAGNDLCDSLAQACGLAGQPRRADAPGDCPERVVALFPDEWQRDAHSAMLHTAFHDAPWDDRGLFGALLLENIAFVP